MVLELSKELTLMKQVVENIEEDFSSTVKKNRLKSEAQTLE